MIRNELHLAYVRWRAAESSQVGCLAQRGGGQGDLNSFRHEKDRKNEHIDTMEPVERDGRFAEAVVFGFWPGTVSGQRTHG